MSASSKFSRREFLSYSGVGLAGLAATVWIPKKVFAAPPAAGTVKRLLILHAGGGMRSTALFNADVAPQWNPYGWVSTTDTDTTGAPLLAAGVQWGVGKPLVGDKTPITLAQWNGVKLPLVSQIANQITVLGAVDHDPSADLGDGNHYSATVRMCTGSENGQNGLLTMLSKELDGQHPLPPTIVGGAGPIGASVYGTGLGDLARYRPIYINGLTDFRYPRTSGGNADPDYVKAIESKLDGDVVAARSNAMGGRAANFIIVKQLGLKYGAVLATDALRLLYVPTAALGMTTDGKPLTNAMLGEPFGVAAGPPPPGFVADQDWGGPTALGVRLLQLGAPVVSVGVGGWDFHSDEDRGLPPLAASLGRALSALYFVLPRMADPGVPGKTYWDTTLIVVTSEFGRDNTSDTPDGGLTIGYNRGNGSDHHGTNACRYQALPVMGGVIPGGRMLVGTDDQVKPMGRPQVSQSLLATLMQAIGVDPVKYFAAPTLPEIYG